MPGNFQGVIEEDGRNLNGGQRQRVEIARALVREPAILVLDEATSALDAVSESEILAAVRRRGMTCVLVAHRLSTIRDCDVIIVLERGKVVERGTHATLMAAAGAYGRAVTQRIAAMGIRDHPIALRSPWQNGYAERLIGSIRRECLDHIVIRGERHLRRVLAEYAKYYNEVRPHLSLDKDSPRHRPAQRLGAIIGTPVLGGLHHQYCRT